MLNAGPLEIRTFVPDADQDRVLAHARGGLLATGGPGTGKTAVLRERFARLVEGGADPERVALFVLSRRAAREARDHLVRRLGRSLPDLPVFTVHGFAFRVLGLRFHDLGYEAPPQVLSAPEQYAVVRDLLGEEAREDWPHHGHLLQVGGFAQQVADLVLRAQERLLGPNDLDRAVEASGLHAYREVAAFYRRYLDHQLASGMTDFAGLLFQAATLLGRDLSTAEAFDHVLVDDYQDATHAAEGILRALAGAATSVVVAADPHGHVFSYRGGSLEPLGRAGEALGCRERVTLDTSHRLGEDAASLGPLEDPGVPAGDPAPRFRSRLFAHPGEEVEEVAHELLRLRVEDDVPWERLAVVVRRYGPYLTALRHALARHDVPFVVVAEAADVAVEPANKPVIDLLRFVFRPDRRADSLEAVLASPVGGVEPHALRELRRRARGGETSLLDFVLTAPPGDLPAESRATVQRFRRLVDELPAVAAERGPDGAFFWLWSELPHVRELVAADRARDLDALSALSDVLARFVERRPNASIEDYLDTLEAAEFGPDPWVPPEERRPHAVRVISAHRAHGAEFDTVMVLGCLEGEFPSVSRPEPLLDLDRVLERPRTGGERLRARLAEERALFRLAVSRARRQTVLFASRSSSVRNPRTPSRFASRLGVPWMEAGDAASPTASLRSMEASLRRRLADRAAPAPSRLAALAALPSVEARPTDWWWGRDWTDPGTPMHGDTIHTSYSRLSTIENCALQYLYAAELGLDPEKTHYMWVGTAVHAIIDLVQRGELPAEEDAVLAELDRRWQRGAFPSRAVERQRHRDARRMLQVWLRDEDTTTLEVAASERRFRFPLDGAEMRGQIDAVLRQPDGRLRVLDYKTSRNPLKLSEVQENLQLLVYYLAMVREPELRELGEVQLVGLAFLGHESYGSFTRRYRPVRADDERKAEEKVRDLLQVVRGEEFGPNPQAECRWCPFKTICPRWPEGQEVPL